MKYRLAVAALIFLLIPTAVHAQAKKSSACHSVDLKAPTKWTGAPAHKVNLRTGPGVSFPLHESGQLNAGERVQVLQECHGWLEVRTIPPRLIDAVIQQNGKEQATKMLLFWVRKDLIRRVR